MISLLELSVELIVAVGSFLEQHDLLNLSLTCDFLRTATEPELYREYNNPNRVVTAHDHRPLKKFVTRLVERPELRHYVKHIALRYYTSVTYLSPNRRIRGDLGLVELSKDEYKAFTKTAASIGLIQKICPYKHQSSVLARIKKYDDRNAENPELSSASWRDFIYGDRVPIQDVSFDTQFCELLRLGIEDPLVVLMMALLPNVREIDVIGTPFDRFALPWRTAHGFRLLKTLSLSPTSQMLVYPLAFYKEALSGAQLATLNVTGAGGIWREENEEDEGPLMNCIPEPLIIPKNATNITRLMLQSCTLNKDDMGVLLQACAPLRSLYYSAGGDIKDSSNFTLPEFVTLMEPHKQSLEALFLDLASEWDFDYDAGVLPTLRDFVSLKFLDTTMESFRDILYGPEETNPVPNWMPLNGETECLSHRLPLSLETLVMQKLDDDNPTHDLFIRHILRIESDKSLPRLNRIICAQHAERDETWGYYFQDQYLNIELPDIKVERPSFGEYWIATPTRFITEDLETKQPTEYTRWVDDRYVQSIKRVAFKGELWHRPMRYGKYFDTTFDVHISEKGNLPADELKHQRQPAYYEDDATDDASLWSTDEEGDEIGECEDVEDEAYEEDSEDGDYKEDEEGEEGERAEEIEKWRGSVAWRYLQLNNI